MAQTTTELDKALSDLHRAETLQETMKKANAIIRSKIKVTERLISEAGMSESSAIKAQQPDYAGRVGFATYELTNNNASIKRLKERVKMLEKKVEGATKAAESGEDEKYTFDGGIIKVNYEEDRVQILLDSVRADRTMYQMFRKNGYVFSPTNKAFQRKITPQAIRNAVQLMNAVKVESQKEIVPEEVIEPNTGDEFDEAIMSNIDPPDEWKGNLIKERNVYYQIRKQLQGNSPIEITNEAKRIFNIYADKFKGRELTNEFTMEKVEEVVSTKKHIRLNRLFNGIPEDTIGEVVEKPNMFVTRVKFGDKVHTIDNGFLSKVEKEEKLRFPNLPNNHPLNILDVSSNQYKEALEQERKEDMPKETPSKTLIAEFKDTNYYFESSTGKFHANVIDGLGNRWNVLSANTIEDINTSKWKFTPAGLDMFPELDMETKKALAKKAAAKKAPAKSDDEAKAEIVIATENDSSVESTNLIGRKLTISKSDYSQISGTVVNVSEQNITLGLGNGITGVEKNVWVTVVDDNGKEHLGTYKFKAGGDDKIQTNAAFKGIDFDYKNQYELNKAIEALLTDRPDAEYSSDTKNWIRKYSGYGGLDKYGKTGKGGLFEYYTPREVIEKMWGLAYKYGYNNGSVLEPSVATGEFLQFAKPETRVVGYEINEFSAKICKILYPTAEIHLQPFEQLFIKNNWTMKDNLSSLEKFDLAIGNPPYGDFSIVESRYMSGMGEKDHTRAKNYVEYFIRRSMDLLKPKGLLIFIVGAQVKNGGTLFLDSGTSIVKEYLHQKCTFLEAYRLPDSIFERTGVTSEIIVLQKN